MDSLNNKGGVGEGEGEETDFVKEMRQEEKGVKKREKKKNREMKKKKKKRRKKKSQVGVKHTKLLQQACFIYFIKEKEIKTQIKIELQISSPKTPQRKP